LLADAAEKRSAHEDQARVNRDAMQLRIPGAFAFAECLDPSGPQSISVAALPSAGERKWSMVKMRALFNNAGRLNGESRKEAHEQAYRFAVGEFVTL
jgi:hypothetical protein